MASPQRQSASISVTEYLSREEEAVEKSEYYAGEIFMMAGASPNHNRISINVIRELSTETRGSHCETFNSDQRLALQKSGLRTYPDVMVVCGEIDYDEQDAMAITNPVLIVEVLSPLTENYDRGKKFEFYREVESFREYLTIHQDKMHIEHWLKSDDGRWILTELRDGDNVLTLRTIDLSVPVAQLYERVEWDVE